MNLSSGRRQEVSLDMTPMIDVVFLLLIFFMVSTTFEHNSEIDIRLPEASLEMLSGKPHAIYVAVTEQGDFFINQEPLVDRNIHTLKSALQQAAMDVDDPPVVISADEQASHQSVVSIMDAARQIGLQKITFAVKSVPALDSTPESADTPLDTPVE